MGRERRRRIRQANAGASGVPGVGSRGVEATSTGAASAHGAHPHGQVRSDRLLARESQTMLSEMRRVAVVSGVCFGMLAILVVVERLQ